MASSLELAQAVMPQFRASVLRGEVRTYGSYARAIGRNEAKESMVVGMAMHAIGAACILTLVPVAPIHYVARADQGWRGIFESAYAEKTKVLPAWNVLAVSARVHSYNEAEFDQVELAIREVIPEFFPKQFQSPRELWRVIAYSKIEGEKTFLDRALAAYTLRIEDARAKRRRH